MKDYTVTISNTFEAVSPEDAVMQMAGWLSDVAWQAGYRVFEGIPGITSSDDQEGIFIDAEDIDQDKVWDEIDGGS